MELIHEPLYFAYGSNMYTRRLEQRVLDYGLVEVAGVYTLEDYKLVFNCGTKHFSYANIVRAPKSKVEGVLYKLNEYQVSILDRHEVWPLNYEKFYFMHNNQLCFCYVSINDRFRSRSLPSHEYMNHLLRGAEEHGLIDTYKMLVRYKNSVNLEHEAVIF